MSSTLVRVRVNAAHELRFTVECLPFATRVAMLQALDREPIIAGAYAADGGLCPQLAARRHGGGATMPSFARAWDGFTATTRRRRHAEARELEVLRAMLQASVAGGDPGQTAFAVGVRALRGHDAARASGWPLAVRHARRHPSWLRPFRRYDEYRAALCRLDELIPEAVGDHGDPLAGERAPTGATQR